MDNEKILDKKYRNDKTFNLKIHFIEGVQKKSAEEFSCAVARIFIGENCNAYRRKADKILVSTVFGTFLWVEWFKSKVQTQMRISF